MNVFFANEINRCIQSNSEKPRWNSWLLIKPGICFPQPYQHLLIVIFLIWISIEINITDFMQYPLMFLNDFYKLFFHLLIDFNELVEYCEPNITNREIYLIKDRMFASWLFYHKDFLTTKHFAFDSLFRKRFKFELKSKGYLHYTNATLLHLYNGL